MKKIIQKIKNILSKKKEEFNIPYIRGIISYTQNAIENGIEDDLNKTIIIYHGNEIYKTYPFSEAIIRVLTDLEHIPFFDNTKKEAFIEGEEIVPSEVYYESI